MHNTVDVKGLKKFDIIYVCGGNTFAILNKLRETKLDQFIIEAVNNGTIYVGVSAGSIIAGPDIEIAGWGSEGDKNEINLKNLSGFNLANVGIFPHFHEELRSEVEEFKKKVSYEVIELTNGEAVLVKNNQVKKI
jgi:dipeptidase E